MSSSNSNRGLSYKIVLKSTAVAGLAAVLLSSGLPARVTGAFAEPVHLDAPQMTGFAPIVKAVSPAVVSVRVESRVQQVSDDSSGFSFDFGPGFDQLPENSPLKRFFKQFGGPDGQKGPGQHAEKKPGEKGPLRPVAQGSGFFISEDGYIVTNNHVVSDGSAYVVVMNDGTELPAKLVGTDPRTDLAVLKVDGKGRKFTYVKWADDSKVNVGDWVVAVGNPFGLGGTVTSGIVSAMGRDINSGPYDDFIQIDAAVNRGNSGGPTFNLNGEVVGINTAIFSPSGGSVGIAFDIPASTAQTVVSELIKSGKIERGWLGVQIQPVTKDIAESLGLSEAQGALVVQPQQDSPGMKAGIRAGDVVTAVNGEPVKDARDLAKRIGAMRPGTKADIALWRDGKSQTVQLTVGTLPPEQKMASKDNNQQDQGDQKQTSLDTLGITVGPTDDGKGVQILSVDPNSAAAEAGIKQGDRIAAVNNKDVNSGKEITSQLDTAKKEGRTKALFQIETDNGSRFVALPTEKG
ncbi:Do family serine endopeptidase [Rhizobium sp. C1]|uniref:Do family serine endopeptidase n=1 Tax=Rhizobium sp. C1 TaxID=1349799 RepID=UPI001E62B7C1|nr:Do family serine endopeptidase [Rhizobium sp. C1]MCD2177506.1 Do family serine endopeptidase [Rhizobium sp. C1]